MIPENYPWLAGLRGMPKTISLGLDLLGTQEVVGKGSNKTIIAWRDELNVAGVKIVGFSDDDIPWCGLLAAILAFRRMKRAAEVVASPLWARNWAKYGTKADKPSLGDVLVFERPGGAHVAFYVAEDATAYHVLGGNQGNRVSITRVLKSRLIAARRPPYAFVPKAVRPYRVAASGNLSRDEA